MKLSKHSSRRRALPYALGLATTLSGHLAFAQPMVAPPNPHGAPAGHAAGHATQRPLPKENTVLPNPDLAPGTLLVRVVSGDEAPISGVNVELHENYQNIAEGGRNSTRRLPSSGLGEARFEKLESSLRFSYSVELDYQGAHYRLDSFRLPEQGGLVATLHVYPSTSSLEEAVVGMRGSLFVGQREDKFQFEFAYQVLSMSDKTWLPKVEIRLPAGKKAFEGARNPEEDGFLETPNGARLVGSYPPGAKVVRGGFLLDRRDLETESFELEIPPNVVDLQIGAEKTPGLVLTVPGFPEPELQPTQDGKKVLLTGKRRRPGSGPERVTIRLSGLPEKSPTRWYAAALAALVALGGLGLGLRGLSKVHPEVEQKRAQAREKLLEELYEIERLHQAGEIGPETFESAKSQLLLALARLLPRPPTPKAG